VRFAGVGVIGTSVHYLTLIFFVQVISVDPLLSSVIGFILGALVNYFLNYHITFRSTKQHREAMIKFFTVALIGLTLNSFIMALAIKIFSLYYLSAQVTATGVILMWNFAGNRLWTFGEKITMGGAN
jgi:putative flippase GtrA